MKMKIIIPFLLFASFCLDCNSIATIAIRLSKEKAVDWNYVQDHGGIKLGEIIKQDNNYYIPIECRASGKKITVEPKDITSYPIYYVAYKLEIKNDSLFITLKEKMDDRIKADINKIIIKNMNERINEIQIYYKNPDNSKIFIKTNKKNT
jgi:hypothetical protein